MARGGTGDSSGATHRPGRRRRGAELVEAIHRATAEELAESGFDGVTFDRVARRGRLSKATLYSRYRTPVQLILETMVANAPSSRDVVPTGSLRGDLREILEVAIGTVRRFGPDMYRRLVGLVGQGEPGLVDVLREQGPLRAYPAVSRAVEAARGRGELGPAPISDAALRAPVEILHSRILLTEDWEDSADEIVDEVVLPLYIALSHRGQG